VCVINLLIICTLLPTLIIFMVVFIRWNVAVGILSRKIEVKIVKNHEEVGKQMKGVFFFCKDCKLRQGT
jgi:hypothetical protein